MTLNTTRRSFLRTGAAVIAGAQTVSGREENIAKEIERRANQRVKNMGVLSINGGYNPAYTASSGDGVYLHLGLRGEDVANLDEDTNLKQGEFPDPKTAVERGYKTDLLELVAPGLEEVHQRVNDVPVVDENVTTIAYDVGTPSSGINSAISDIQSQSPDRVQNSLNRFARHNRFDGSEDELQDDFMAGVLREGYSGYSWFDSQYENAFYLAKGQKRTVYLEDLGPVEVSLENDNLEPKLGLISSEDQDFGFLIVEENPIGYFEEGAKVHHHDLIKREHGEPEATEYAV